MTYTLPKSSAEKPQFLDDKMVLSWVTRDHYVYKVLSLDPIDEQLAKIIQSKICRRPHEGYSFLDFEITLKEGYFETCWRSWRECE